MKPVTLTTAVVLALAATSSAAQEAPASPAQAPTPEAAAKFIDSVLMNGVAKIIYLDSPDQYAGGYAPADVRTADCKTVVTGPAGTVQRIFEIDWRSYVVADSLFAAGVTNRPAVRVLVKTNVQFVMTSSGTRSTQTVGVAVEPGPEELKNRLTRAMEFYGKSCAPKLDGPF